MSNVIDELVYNIKMSSHINIVFIVLLTALFWLLTLLSSYYLELLSIPGFQNVSGDYAYYSLSANVISNDEASEYLMQAFDYEYVDKMRRTLGDIQAVFSSSYICVDINNQFTTDYDFMMERLGNDRFRDYMKFSAYPGYYYKPENSNDSTLQRYSNYWTNNACYSNVFWIDENAMKHFGLRAAEGDIFASRDFIYAKNQTEIPVLMGSAYAPYFELDETFDMYNSKAFQARVVGFLEKDIVVMTDMIFEVDGYPMTLDYSIVVPLFHCEDEPQDEFERDFVLQNYSSYLFGTLVTDRDVPRSEITKMERQIHAIFVENGLFPLSLDGSPYGVGVFKKESEHSVSVLFTLVIVVALFSVFSICLYLIAKIDRNLRRYAIEIMNGQSMATIIASFFLEVLSIVIASALLAGYLLKEQINVNQAFLLFVALIALFIVVIVSIVIIKKLKSIDIEELLRRSE